jgi:hypothetical protein
MRVVFGLNASASDLAPFESIWLSVEWCVSVYEYIKRYIEWYIVILYWFMYSHPRLSWVRVVFDFNASASDSAPFEPTWFPVEWCVSVCVDIQRVILSDILLYYIDLFTHIQD